MENGETGDTFWDNELKLWRKMRLICKRCSRPYKEYNNIGQWNCSQHASIETPTVGQRWKCCGALRKSTFAPREGCVRADHAQMNAPYDDTHNIPLLKLIAKKVCPKKEAIVKVDAPDNPETYRDESDKIEAEEEYVQVRRYDLNAQTLRYYNIIENGRPKWYNKYATTACSDTLSTI